MNNAMKTCLLLVVVTFCERNLGNLTINFLRFKTLITLGLFDGIHFRYSNIEP